MNQMKFRGRERCILFKSTRKRNVYDLNSLERKNNILPIYIL